MNHTPYGYLVENGKAVVDEEKAEQVRKLYENYLSGLGLKNAAEEAGIKTYHGTAGKMLSNKKYLGTKYYPQIIDSAKFDLVQEEREKRAKALGRIRDTEEIQIEEPPKLYVPPKFWMKPLEVRFGDPYKQAEFAYSLIESEVT